MQHVSMAEEGREGTEREGTIAWRAWLSPVIFRSLSLQLSSPNYRTFKEGISRLSTPFYITQVLKVTKAGDQRPYYRDLITKPHSIQLCS